MFKNNFFSLSANIIIFFIAFLANVNLHFSSGYKLVSFNFRHCYLNEIIILITSIIINILLGKLLLQDHKSNVKNVISVCLPSVLGLGLYLGVVIFTPEIDALKSHVGIFGVFRRFVQNASIITVLLFVLSTPSLWLGLKINERRHSYIFKTTK